MAAARHSRQSAKTVSSLFSDEARRTRALARQRQQRDDFFGQLRDRAVQALLAAVDPTGDQQQQQQQQQAVVERHRIGRHQNAHDEGSSKVGSRKSPAAAVTPAAEVCADEWLDRPAVKYDRLMDVRRRPSVGASNALSAWICRNLVQPDFLVDVPANLATDWLVFVRPEGKRVLLVATGGRCCAFSKGGCLEATFACALPGMGVTVLEGVMVTPREPAINSHIGGVCDGMNNDECAAIAPAETAATAIGVFDVLCWNDCALGDAQAECRQFLLKSRFEDHEAELSAISPLNERCMFLLPTYDASSENLQRLYSEPHPNFWTDSLVFLSKTAFYIPGPSSDYLTWRDFQLSRWPVDTVRVNGADVPPRLQQANLLLRLADGTLLTEDRCVVGRLPVKDVPARLQALPPTIFLNKWKQGRIKDVLLVKAEFSEIDFHQATCVHQITVGQGRKQQLESLLLRNVRLIGTPSPRRLRAESVSRLLHQAIMRRHLAYRNAESKLPPPLTFRNIVECAASGLPFTRAHLCGYIPTIDEESDGDMPHDDQDEDADDNNDYQFLD